MTKATNINSYELEGKYLFENYADRVETTELIDCEEVYWDESNGYTYNGKSLNEYVKEC